MRRRAKDGMDMNISRFLSRHWPLCGNSRLIMCPERAAITAAWETVINLVSYLFAVNQCWCHTQKPNNKQANWQVLILSAGVMHRTFSLLRQTSSPSFTSFSLSFRQCRQAEIQIDRLADLSNQKRGRDKDRQLVWQADKPALLDRQKNWNIQRDKLDWQGAKICDGHLESLRVFSHLRLFNGTPLLSYPCI